MPTKHNSAAVAIGVLLTAFAAGGVATTTPASAQANATDAVVRSAAGPGVDDVKTAVEQFRADLGGGAVAGANGSFGGLRREINWDGVPDQFSSPNDFPADFFNTRSPRGVVFSTPGLNFQLSAKATTGVRVRFGNINPVYVTDFSVFSPERLFTPVGSTITNANFFVPGTKTPAAVTGFGAVFTDVDNSESSSISLYDVDGALIKRYNVPASPGNGSLSFLGVRLPGPARIARVRIESGKQILADGTQDSEILSRDKVAMDDFIFAEPVIVAESTGAAPTSALTNDAPTTTVSGSKTPLALTPKDAPAADPTPTTKPPKRARTRKTTKK